MLRIKTTYISPKSVCRILKLCIIDAQMYVIGYSGPIKALTNIQRNRTTPLDIRNKTTVRSLYCLCCVLRMPSRYSICPYCLCCVLRVPRVGIALVRTACAVC